MTERETTVQEVIFNGRACWAIVWSNGTMDVPFPTETDARNVAGLNTHQAKTRWQDAGFRAECSCNWVGPWRASATEALIDGHSHTKVARDDEKAIQAWGGRP